MKTLITRLMAVAAVATLGGCAVVPYGAPYSNYGGGYVAEPAYGPAYAPAYVGPPVYLGFGYRRGWHGHDHYRGGWR